MKIRVLVAETGKVYRAKENEKIIFNSFGEPSILLDEAGYGEYSEWNLPEDEEFIVEFAFRKDEDNQWIWEHSVIHD